MRKQKAQKGLENTVVGMELLKEQHVAKVEECEAREREEEAKTNARKPLDIQDQIFQSRTTLLESNFGKRLNSPIAHENALKEQLESLEKKLQEVMGGMGHEVKTVMEEQAKTQNKLERLQLKRRTLLLETHATGI